MSQQNINQYNYKKWFITQHKPIFDISLASDERDYNEEVVFSTKLIGENDGNRLPIHFDLNNSGSSQMMTINYGDYFSANTLVSLNYYNPKNEDLSCFTATTLCDIGLTGIDNGLSTQISGDTLYYTMGLFTGDSKWDRFHFDRRLKLIPVTSNTNEPLTIDLNAQITSGSIVINYTLTANQILYQDVTVTFTNILEVVVGDPIIVSSGVTIYSGYSEGTSLVILPDQDYNNLSKVVTFTNLNVISSYPVTIASFVDTYDFPSPTPTPTPSITPSPTPICVQFITDELGNYLISEDGNYIISELNPCVTPTPTPSPTRQCVQFLTDETGNLLIAENGNYIISELNPCVTPTPTRTPTQTKTPTNTPTSSPTPSPFYYYYNLLDCNNSNNKVGRSITGGLTGIYNVDVDKCYSIVGILFGSSYDYDLDLSTLVTNCNDILCIQPTLTPTPTPSVTPIICDTFTFTGNNVITTTNSATKTSSGGWDGAAYSVETYTTPVSVSFQVSNNNAYLMGGFSYNPNATPGNTYVDITYGLYIQPNFLEIYEYGNQVTIPGSMTNTTSDMWKVDYNGTDVKYYKNNVLIYTSSNAVTQPLHIYFPILTQGDGVTNVCVTAQPLPTPTPTATMTPTPSFTPNCVRQIVVPTLWDGGTNINSNTLKLTQTSETLQIRVNDIITDFNGSTSIVGYLGSDGTYTYVFTGPGGGVAFPCQFPLTFSGPC